MIWLARGHAGRTCYEHPPSLSLHPHANLLNEEKDPDVTESQKKEISILKRHLRLAYKDAPVTNYNNQIYDIVDGSWHTVRYDPGNKSLPYILHVEKGWTGKSIVEVSY